MDVGKRFRRVVYEALWATVARQDGQDLEMMIPRHSERAFVPQGGLRLWADRLRANTVELDICVFWDRFACACIWPSQIRNLEILC